MISKVWPLSSHVKRYLLIGVSVYGFELLVIILAQSLGASSLLAVGLSFWLGLLVSFGLQKLVTFGDKRLHHKIVAAQFAAVLMLVVFNFGFTLLVTGLFDDYFSALVCRTIALAITTVWNFYIYKAFIFKTKAAH